MIDHFPPWHTFTPEGSELALPASKTAEESFPESRVSASDLSGVTLKDLPHVSAPQGCHYFGTLGECRNPAGCHRDECDLFRSLWELPEIESPDVIANPALPRPLYS